MTSRAVRRVCCGMSASSARQPIPLLFLPNLRIEPVAAMPRKTRRLARLVMFGDGLRAGAFHFTWAIAPVHHAGLKLCRLWRRTLAGGNCWRCGRGLFVGRSIDLGNGRRAAQIGFAVLALEAVLARAFGYPYPWSAVVANAMAAVAMPIYSTAFDARVYTLAQQSPCPLRFHIVAEGGWDLGTATACFTSAGLIYLGFSFFWPLMLALVACGLGYFVLTRTFAVESGLASQCRMTLGMRIPNPPLDL